MRKIKNFLDEVWREVHPTKGRVVWPDRDKLMKSTYVVVGMSALVGVFVWLADSGFGKVVKSILFF